MQRSQKDSYRAVILTALSIEYQAAREHLDHPREVEHKSTIYTQGTFISEGRKCEVCIAFIDKGNASAASEAERAIAYFNPRFAFFMGVAGGLKDVKLGDVVAATEVYNYEAGKEGAIFQPRPEAGRSSYKLVQRARIEATRPVWYQRLGRDVPEPPPNVFVAPIVAGESVQSSTCSVTYKLIRANYSHAVAVEMEGYGFLRALHPYTEVGALVIRGISDLIDGKSEADAAHSQEIAARHASAFMFEVLAKLINQPDSEAVNVGTSQDGWKMPPLSPLTYEGDFYHLQNGDFNTGIDRKSVV